jgi:AraC-like DNA-binding protein
MLSHERGALPGSQYHFFSPSDRTRQYYYYFVWAGHYYCTSSYDIQRDYYFPLLLMSVRAGNLHLVYEERREVARAGDVLLIDCQLPHHYWADDGLEFVYFHFDGLNAHDYCRFLIQQNGGPVFRLGQNKKINAMIYETVTRLANSQQLSDAECSSILYSTMTQLAYQDDFPLDSNSPVSQAMRYIRAHWDHQITLEEIAAHVNLSPYYFSRLFKSETGYSPVQFAQKTRMDVAKTLLKTTSEPIESIALKIGFGCGGSFRNAFIKQVGLSPTKFRNFPI